MKDKLTANAKAMTEMAGDEVVCIRVREKGLVQPVNLTQVVGGNVIWDTFYKIGETEWELLAWVLGETICKEDYDRLTKR